MNTEQTNKKIFFRIQNRLLIASIRGKVQRKKCRILKLALNLKSGANL